MVMPRANLVLFLMLPLVAGCGMTSGSRSHDLHAIKACAAEHPPPPEGNVERLGLVPVYLTQSSASDSPAMKQWYVTMDQCTGSYRPPSPNPGK
jgi:hypothetical protein